MENSNFKSYVQEYLDSLAEQDPLFANTLKKENKSIDECLKYIVKTIQSMAKDGIATIHRSEIEALARHYYDEDDIKTDSSNINYEVVVPRPKIELTAQEIEDSKEKARTQIYSDEYSRMHKHKKAVKSTAKTIDSTENKSSNSATQNTLF